MRLPKKIMKNSKETRICKNEECFKKAKKNKGLSRALKTNVNDENYNEIRGVMFD